MQSTWFLTPLRPYARYSVGREYGATKNLKNLLIIKKKDYLCQGKINATFLSNKTVVGMLSIR